VSSDDSISVPVGSSSQVISVDDSFSADALRLQSVIATGKILDAVVDTTYLRYAWERNRFSDLVGFTVDRRQRLLGESWVPLDGLQSKELALQLRELARVCDWHEFRLTGENIE